MSQQRSVGPARSPTSRLFSIPRPRPEGRPGSFFLIWRPYSRRYPSQARDCSLLTEAFPRSSPSLSSQRPTISLGVGRFGVWRAYGFRSRKEQRGGWRSYDCHLRLVECECSDAEGMAVPSLFVARCIETSPEIERGVRAKWCPLPRPSLDRSHRWDTPIFPRFSHGLPDSEVAGGEDIRAMK